MFLPPPRALSGRFWHQAGPARQVKDFAQPSVTQGRYHDLGDSGVWYASSQEQAAWAELLRHYEDDNISPSEQKRRVGRVTVDDLQVLDLTDPQILSAMRIESAQLTAESTDYCRSISRAARGAYEGILAPSAALPGQQTLVVFPVGMTKVTVELDRVRRTPSRVLDLVDSIVLLPPARALVASWVGELLRRRRQLVGQLRRQLAESKEESRRNAS